MPKKSSARKEATPEVDWKSIALEMASWLKFGINHLTSRPGQTGMLLNTESKDAEVLDTRHWSEFYADALDKIPGLQVDREMMHTMQLSPAARKKAQEKLRKSREQKA